MNNKFYDPLNQLPNKYVFKNRLHARQIKFHGKWKIQAFPVNEWENEFKIANNIGIHLNGLWITKIYIKTP